MTIYLKVDLRLLIKKQVTKPVSKKSSVSEILVHFVNNTNKNDFKKS